MEILPIGSIVKINNLDKTLMIMGYNVKSINGDDKDYASVLYPEGLVSKESIFTFNASDINEIISRGYNSVAFKKFSEFIKKEMN